MCQKARAWGAQASSKIYGIVYAQQRRTQPRSAALVPHKPLPGGPSLRGRDAVPAAAHQHIAHGGQQAQHALHRARLLPRLARHPQGQLPQHGLLACAARTAHTILAAVRRPAAAAAAAAARQLLLPPPQPMWRAAHKACCACCAALQEDRRSPLPHQQKARSSMRWPKQGQAWPNQSAAWSSVGPPIQLPAARSARKTLDMLQPGVTRKTCLRAHLPARWPCQSSSNRAGRYQPPGQTPRPSLRAGQAAGLGMGCGKWSSAPGPLHRTPWYRNAWHGMAWHGTA